MTRHHNGFFIEKYLKQIIKSKEKWVTPFIILLIGKYVFEILAYSTGLCFVLQTCHFR